MNRQDDLSAEIAKRLMERLEWIKINPEVIIDLGCGSSEDIKLLQNRYPGAVVIGCDKSNRSVGIRANAEALPFASGSVDFIYSNMMLPWVVDPQCVFNEVRRVLKPNGLFFFASLGPDTLREARLAWAQVDSHKHINDFEDMHNIGDMLAKAGLVDPVVDTEWLTATYSNPIYLLEELKQAGSYILDRTQKGTTSRSALNKFKSSYETLIEDNEARYPATFEIIYGHAWGNNMPAYSQEGNETSISLEALRRNLRRLD